MARRGEESEEQEQIRFSVVEAGHGPRIFFEQEFVNSAPPITRESDIPAAGHCAHDGGRIPNSALDRVIEHA